jgi:hypothetical protein
MSLLEVTHMDLLLNVFCSYHTTVYEDLLTDCEVLILVIGKSCD